MSSFDYDFFVIGAGSGGVRAARIATSHGAKVAIAEELYLGGTCVNVGCVPKKLFVYASEFSEEFKASSGFGWSEISSKLDWQRLRENKNNEIKRLNGVYHTILASAGAEIIDGKATIIDGNTLDVKGTQYTAEKILISTGGWPRKPHYPGAEHTLDSNQFFFLDELPNKVVVEGGGYIAVEFAGILNGLGCETELIYRSSLFLRGFDQDIREFIRDEMIKKGVKLRFNSEISSVSQQNHNTYGVVLKDGRTLSTNAVVTAIGRSPKLDGLGLENTQISLNKKGFIDVDKNFQTHHKGIYAVGDVIGRAALTPVALAEGMALSNYLFNNTPISLEYSNIPTAVFCQPNIGTVGMTEDKAAERGIDVEIYKSEFKPLKNTLSGVDERTLMKLIVDKTNRKVVGAHMVGPSAGEIMQGIAIAINAGATKETFDQTIGIHPTSAEEFVTMRAPFNG